MTYSWLYRTRTRALLGIMLALSLAACGDGHSPTASEGADAQDLSLVEDRAHGMVATPRPSLPASRTRVCLWLPSRPL